jgi:glycerate-2-kinase
MARAAEQALGERIAGGLVVTAASGGGPPTRLARIELCVAGHPLPDARGKDAASRMLALVRDAAAEAAAGGGPELLFLLSGGASALLPAPPPGVTLRDEQLLTELLLSCGAEIAEVNAVRKHLSLLKGGRIAVAAHPARVITLAVSDVIGGTLADIGSGPTVADPTTFAEARAVLLRRQLWRCVPASIRQHLLAGEAGQVPETPKPGDARLAGEKALVVSDNAAALAGCAQEASARGMVARIVAGDLRGEAREVGRRLAQLAVGARAPACLIAGGETTVVVRGGGRGGRNQELALSAAIALDGARKVALLSAGTDGIDGPTDAAGAIAMGDTIMRARAAGLDAARHLADNDAYPFFDRLGDLVRTGPTGTNVMDVQLVLVVS